MPVFNIPGFYFDEERRKYFKIQPSHLAPAGSKFTQESLKRQAEQQEVSCFSMFRYKSDEYVFFQNPQNVAIFIFSRCDARHAFSPIVPRVNVRRCPRIKLVFSFNARPNRPDLASQS